MPRDKTYKRKADKQGRISLPTSKYAEKTLEIAVLDTKEQTWERRKDKEGGNTLYEWWHKDRDETIRVIYEEPEYYTIQGVRGHEKHGIAKAESPSEAYEKAENWIEKHSGQKV